MSSDEYRKLVTECADDGARKSQEIARSGGWSMLYLFFTRSSPGVSGRLFLLADDDPIPDGAERAFGALTPDVPYSDYARWVDDRARKLPILAY